LPRLQEPAILALLGHAPIPDKLSDFGLDRITIRIDRQDIASCHDDGLCRRSIGG
jgi:hypothetical protein